MCRYVASAATILTCIHVPVVGRRGYLQQEQLFFGYMTPIFFSKMSSKVKLGMITPGGVVTNRTFVWCIVETQVDVYYTLVLVAGDIYSVWTLI